MRAVPLIVAALALTASNAATQGWIEPIRPMVDFGVSRTRTSVSVRVTGRVALVEVEEWFTNRGGGMGEGDYLYPLPGEAVFSNFSLFQGDQELRGETMDAGQARSIYEEIVRKKRDPALIELAGHGLIRARVFPINAGETRKITLRYTQVLARAGDALHFRYAAGGRHDRTRVNRTEGAIGPQRTPEATPLTFSLTADSSATYGEPFSPTHQLEATRDRGRLTVRPTGQLEGDFALFLPLARGLVGMTVVTHKPSGEDGYFMLTLSPNRVAGRAVPRDVTAVIDVSGSMSGEKMEQARSALHQLLTSLGEHDRFRLIAFSNGVSTYRADWTIAARAETEAAHRWVDGLAANGGTNIAGALTEAFRAPSPSERLAIVVFLTDGLPSVGEQNPERIADQIGRQRAQARVFAFGVGYDVNTYLLDRLGAAGRGVTEYVEPGENVSDALGTLAAKIQHPVLVDLTIGNSPAVLTEVYPTDLPDLFAGEELVVFGRYRAGTTDRTGDLALTGRRDNREERFQVRATFPDHETGNDFIPRLWASRKLGLLTQQVRLNGSNPELIEEIRSTAMRYGLLSEYTSYLVQEPVQVAANGFRSTRDSTRIDRALPASLGAASGAVGQQAVRVAEESRANREVKSSADLRDAERAYTVRALESAGGPNSSRRTVAGRVFVLRNGVWTDQRHADSLRVVDVEPFSEAYFRLLEQLPELAPYWQAFDHVVVTGARISIRLASSKGPRELQPGEVRSVVAAFRGR